MIYVALSHDVDKTLKTYQYITKILKSLLSLDMKSFLYQISSLFRKNPYWNFDKIIEIENEYNVKSTFFFLNESIRFKLFNIKNWKLSLGNYKIDNSHIVKTIKYLHENGWEIGVHGSYNSYKSYDLLKTEKDELESIVGHKIIGIRQHYLNLNEDTWKLQQEAGYLYDASLGYTRNIGFKDEIYFPFQPLKKEFLVFPLPIMDFCLINKKNSWESFLQLMDDIEARNGILVINWHQRVFNNQEFPGYRELYIKIIEECLRRNAKFSTLSELHNNFIVDSNIN